MCPPNSESAQLGVMVRVPPPTTRHSPRPTTGLARSLSHRHAVTARRYHAPKRLSTSTTCQNVKIAASVTRDRYSDCDWASARLGPAATAAPMAPYMTHCHRHTQPPGLKYPVPACHMPFKFTDNPCGQVPPHCPLDRAGPSDPAPINGPTLTDPNSKN